MEMVGVAASHGLTRFLRHRKGPEKALASGGSRWGWGPETALGGQNSWAKFERAGRVPKGTSWEEDSRCWTEVSQESEVAETSGAVEGGGRVEAGEMQDLGLYQEERSAGRHIKPVC